MRRNSLLPVAAAALSLIATAAVPAAALAGDGPAKPRTLTRHLLTPLSLAVEGDDVYVTQNFAGVLNKVRPGKTPKTVYAASGGHEVGGVSVRRGVLVFAETASDEQGNPSDSWVRRISPAGKVRTIAHVRAFEDAHNPDATIEYGIRDLTDECAAQWPAEAGPVSYQGLPDSHPYATYQTKNRVFVADAGMNAVLAVSRGGAIRTVAVTPATEVPVTADLATTMGLPDCTVGHTYYGESVPTDVELGPDGKLYVTTEGGGLGEQLPLGAVYRIDPKTGATEQVAGGLMTPTGVGVTARGDLIVAELFAGRLSMIRRGTSAARPYASVGLPGAVEVAAGKTYATIDVLPPDGAAPDGKVVLIRR